MTRKKCSVCKRKVAVYTVRNAFQSTANGKVVCGSNVCWGSITGGYPAEGRAINPETPKA